jgi:hypothetical protein
MARRRQRKQNGEEDLKEIEVNVKKTAGGGAEALRNGGGQILSRQRTWVDDGVG